MKLYHGSNIEVSEPKILEPTHATDFGSGFYLTRNLDQSVRWAKRLERVRGTGVATITKYEFDESAFTNLNILQFESTNESWLEFVKSNRLNIGLSSEYDAVIGPVADDTVYPTVILYTNGEISAEAAILELNVRELYTQIALKSTKSLGYLKFESSEALI